MTSELPLPLATPRDLFGKLKRDAELLEEEVTTDRFFNFVITGYSLIDWVEAEPNLSGLNVKDLCSNHWMKVCGDLATAAKHFRLTRRSSITASVKSQAGFGVGRFGRGGYGVGEESITIN